MDTANIIISGGNSIGRYDQVIHMPTRRRGKVVDPNGPGGSYLVDFGHSVTVEEDASGWKMGAYEAVELSDLRPVSRDEAIIG